MPDPASNHDLLRALGRLVRGLSALFWGLPVALVVCVQAARLEWLKPFGVVPPLVTTGLLFYGLLQLRHFQPQERVWRHTLDRAQLLALINVGLSPFLYWWNKVPTDPFFDAVVLLLGITGLLFLSHLNLVLRRLAAMLPDETLRQETRQFTTLNHGLLLGALFWAIAYVAWSRWPVAVPPVLIEGGKLASRVGLWLFVVLVLLPLAMTMALLWKTKEVILDGVFGGGK